MDSLATLTRKILTTPSAEGAATLASMSLDEVGLGLALYVRDMVDASNFGFTIHDVLDEEGEHVHLYEVPASFHMELERTEDAEGNHFCTGFEVFAESACEFHPDAVLLRPCCDVAAFIFTKLFPAPYEPNECGSCSGSHVATFAFFPHLFVRATIKPTQEDVALAAIREALRGEFMVNVEPDGTRDPALGASPVTIVRSPSPTSLRVPLTALGPDMTMFCWDDGVLDPAPVRTALSNGLYLFR